MSAKGGTSLGTLLVSVPLAAIPLMAIFGIPEFAPVVASPDADEISLGGSSRDPGDVDRYRDQAGDILDEYGGRLSEPLRDAPQYNPFEASESENAERQQQSRPPALGSSWPPHADTENTAHESHARADLGDPQDPGDARWADEAGHANRDSSASRDGETASLTWQAASRRLNDLAIDDYHLEPGFEEGTFLFVCAFAPDGDPNVMMRFEAESSEPLAAVEDVLSQVDRWLRQRFAESRRVPVSAGP